MTIIEWIKKTLSLGITSCLVLMVILAIRGYYIARKQLNIQKTEEEDKGDQLNE